MASFDDFYKTFDSSKEREEKNFERFVIWFLKNHPLWESKVKDIWLWDNHPKRSEWGDDNGIDIVFNDENGERWAVQAKLYAPKYYIKKSDLDSFISEADPERFKNKLLITSTNLLGNNAISVLERNKVVRFMLKDFQNSPIDFPKTANDLFSGKKIKPKTPRPHQTKAINEIIKNLKNENKGQVIMACGTGKTLTSLFLKEKLKAENVLVLLPSLNLLSQTLAEWTANATHKFKWLGVCSDKTVAKKEDEWIMNTSELGLPVTSNSMDIKIFLKEKGSKVIFSTYQSSLLIAEIFEDANVAEFDLTIADEAHNCAGKVSREFSSILNDDLIRSRKKLFFTATPRILSSQIKSYSKERDIEIASMDNEIIFGKVLHKLNFSDAIKNKLLSDYRVIVIGIDDFEVEEKIKNRDLLTTSGELTVDAETFALNIALSKAIKKYDLERIITFHSRVVEAEKFAKNFSNILEMIPSDNRPLGNIICNSVNGRMKTSERIEKINTLKNLNEGNRSILSNARCLSEGVDVPTLDGVAFIDPKKSEVDIVQAVGRAIRKSEKSKGTIIIPVYLGKLEDIESEILASKFSNVWNVVSALKSHDDELMDQIDNLRISLGEKTLNSSDFKGLKINFDLPKERIDNKFFDSINTLMIENTSQFWMQRYGELKKFIKENGHSMIDTSKSSLGIWVGTQRVQFNKSKLSKERIKLLNDIDFIWDPINYIFTKNIELLKSFIRDNGHCLVPRNEPFLGEWVHSLRVEYKRGGISNNEKLKILNELGFIWDSLEYEWENNYKKLKEFFQKHGHSDVPLDSPLLGWVRRQRDSRKGNQRNNLNEEKIKKLDELKFNWNPFENAWKNNIKALQVHYLKYGTTNIPRTVDKTLNHFVAKLRQDFKKGKLPEDKIKILENLNFEWDPLERMWELQFEKAKEYFTKNGHLNISRNTLEETSRWLTKQRTAYKKNKLKAEYIKKLESLNINWNPIENKWDIYFEIAKEFFLQNGHLKLASKNKKMTGWIERQRKLFKDGKLSKDQIDKLESIKIDWDPIENAWNKKFEKAKSFFLENGHLSPGRNFPEIMGWVSKQRAAHKKGKLSKDKAEKLESIKIVWDPRKKFN